MLVTTQNLGRLIVAAALVAPACSGGSVSPLNEPAPDGGSTGSDGGTATGNLSSTSELSPATVAGVCSKYNLLACALPNCEAQLTLVEQTCSAESGVFQGLLNCLAVATMNCESGSTAPVVSECTNQEQQASVCTGGSGG